MNELNFNEEIKPKKSKLPIIIIGIVLIGAIAATSFIVYKQVFTDKTVDNTAKETENKTKDDNKEQEEIPKEEIQNKEYVIDATYKYNVTKSEYHYYKDIMKSSDIVVPYLNIKTKEAENINDEIKKLYEYFMEMYEDFSSEELDLNVDETESYDYIKTKYSYTIKNDIISILIEVERTGRGSSEAEEYYAFNYDLKEEKKLSLKELCNKLEINYDNTLKKVNEQIETTFNKTFFSEVEADEEEKAMQIEYIAENKNYFNNQIKDNKVTSYIDKNNQLNIKVYNEHPFGGCGFYYDTLTITK